MPFESRYNSLKGIISVIASFTITGVLTLTGATITGALLPTTSDGAAIGSATKMWSDLFLASGGVINWNNGNMTITHAADTLTTAGGNITINDTGSNPVVTIKRTGAYSPLRLYSTGDGTHNEGNYDIYAYGTGGSQDIIFEPANWGATVQFRGNSGIGVWNGAKFTMEGSDVSNKGNALVNLYDNDVSTIQLDADGISYLNSGKLGLWDTTPAAKLDVVGTTRLEGTTTTVLTGSIDPIASATVTGVGTLFQTELVIGDLITVSGETRMVTAIASNTSLTVDSAFSNNANDTSPDVGPAALTVADETDAVMLLFDYTNRARLAATSGLTITTSALGADGLYSTTDDQVLNVYDGKSSASPGGGYGNSKFRFESTTDAALELLSDGGVDTSDVLLTSGDSYGLVEYTDNASELLTIGTEAAGNIIFVGNGGVGLNIEAPTTNITGTNGLYTTSYVQFNKTFAGAPTAADCDNNAERGRLAIDTTNNRLYVCNGGTRLWDYVALTD